MTHTGPRHPSICHQLRGRERGGPPLAPGTVWTAAVLLTCSWLLRSALTARSTLSLGYVPYTRSTSLRNPTKGKACDVRERVRRTPHSGERCVRRQEYAIVRNCMRLHGATHGSWHRVPPVRWYTYTYLWSGHGRTLLPNAERTRKHPEEDERLNERVESSRDDRIGARARARPTVGAGMVAGGGRTDCQATPRRPIEMVWPLS